jgi:hypothetical protein
MILNKKKKKKIIIIIITYLPPNKLFKKKPWHTAMRLCPLPMGVSSDG